jgi:hypothetical protein
MDNPIMAQISAGRNVPANPNTPIYIGQRVIGNVRGDTFCKTVTGSKHFLRSPKAICFDRSTLRDAAAAGATCAAIFDRETGTTYTAALATIDAYSFPVHRGHGDQVGVPLDHWSVNGATPVAEQRAAQTNQERNELQLSLFGEVA